MALPSDELISRNGLTSIRKHVPIVIRGLKVIVQGGHVTLQGQVSLGFLSTRAETVVRQLEGVTGLTNQIVVVPRSTPKQPGSPLAQPSSASTSSMGCARLQTTSATASMSFKSTTGTPAPGNL
jgi:hypothetical protein